MATRVCRRGRRRRAQRVASREAQLAELEAHSRNLSFRGRSSLIRQRETLQAKLAQDCATQAQYRFRPDQLVIIDEASMVSTTNLAEISRQAEAAGAKLLIVGDPAQLEAVDAGGFLGHVERHLDHSTLDTIWRFKNEWEKRASLRLRRGDSDVVDHYRQQGRIHGDPDTDAADAAYTAWRDDRAAGLASILIASDNETVSQLNARAHADLVEAGAVVIDTEVTLRAEVRAGVGDVLLARRNDRSIRDSSGSFVANGTRMTITAINPDGSAHATVHTGDAGTPPSIILDADYLASSVELGYATTAHRSQGVTVDTGHAVVTPKLSRELFYVAMTRGKHGNHAYVDFEQPESPTPDDWHLLTSETRVAGEPVTDPSVCVKAVVARSTAEKSAHETRDAELGWSNDIGRLCHELSYLNWAAKVTRTQQWLKSEVPSTVRETLPWHPSWQQLVSMDPGENFHGEVTDTDTAETIIGFCRRPHAPTLTGPGAMITAASPETDEQSRLWESTLVDLADQVAARRAVLAADPPDWFLDLTEHLAAHPRRDDVLDAVIVWRGVSDQADADTALGKESHDRDYLRPYWDRLQTLVKDPEPGEYADEHSVAADFALDPIDWESASPSPEFDSLDDCRSQPANSAPHGPPPHLTQEFPSIDR